MKELGPGALPEDLFNEERPLTQAVIHKRSKLQAETGKMSAGGTRREEEAKTEKARFRKEVTTAEAKRGGIRGRRIKINILDSWGDIFYVGLAGIELYDERMQEIPLDIS